MYPTNREKRAFQTKKANFCHKVMPFVLKNAGATYPRLMDRMFQEQIGRTIEGYVDDVIVKSDSVQQNTIDLAKVFDRLRQYDMRLNRGFGVQGGKF